MCRTQLSARRGYAHGLRSVLTAAVVASFTVPPPILSCCLTALAITRPSQRRYVIAPHPLQVYFLPSLGVSGPLECIAFWVPSRWSVCCEQLSVPAAAARGLHKIEQVLYCSSCILALLSERRVRECGSAHLLVPRTLEEINEAARLPGILPTNSDPHYAARARPYPCPSVLF
jgi:hypothetical protein